MDPSDSAPDAAPPRLSVASLAKGLRVLEAVAEAQRGGSLNELTAATGLDRTTVHRILRTLLAEGYVVRTGRGQYAVAPRGFALGAVLSRGSQLATVGDTVLRRLREETGETAHIAVLDGTDVLCAARVTTDKLLAINFAVGTRLPAYATSLGRAILAHLAPEPARDLLRRSDRRRSMSLTHLVAKLDEVRRDGYAISRGEMEPGLWAVAAPILDGSGHPLAAINVVVPAYGLDEDRLMDRLVPPVVRAAGALSDAFASPRGGDNGERLAR